MDNLKAIFVEAKDEIKGAKIIRKLNENGYFFISVNMLKDKSIDAKKEIADKIKRLNHVVIDADGDLDLAVSGLNVIKVQANSDFEEVIGCLI